MKIALLACSNRKQNIQQAPAQEMYTGELFRLSLRLCREILKPDKTLILSSKYGVLEPTQPIARYDQYLGTLDADRRRHWAWKVSAALYQALEDYIPDLTWHIFAGKLYREHLVKMLPGRIIVPLKSLGLGQQQRRLRQWLAKEIVWPH